MIISVMQLTLHTRKMTIVFIFLNFMTFYKFLYFLHGFHDLIDAVYDLFASIDLHGCRTCMT